MRAVDKLETIQKVIDLAMKKVPDVKISKQLGLKIPSIYGIRSFYGLQYHKNAIDIREDTKVVVKVPFRITFSLVPFAMDFNMTPNKNYIFKAIKTDNEAKTITLKIYEEKNRGVK